MDDRDSRDTLSRPSQRARPQKLFFWTGMALLCAAVAFSAGLFWSDRATVQTRKDVIAHYKLEAQFRLIKRGQQDSSSQDRGPDISWFRRLLGDEPVRLILLPRHTTADEQANVRIAFPEAQVMLFPID